MKKMLFAGLAIAAMAALGVSCQKNALQTLEGRRAVSFEASIASAPGTKFSMTDEGTYVKASWEVGDEIAVLWYAGTDDVTAETYEKFTVTKVSSDGKSATFSNEYSAFPATGEVTAMFVYPYLDYFTGDGYYYHPTGSFTAAEVADPGETVVYFAKDNVTDGAIPALTFTQQNSFLYIKSGTVFSGVTEGSYWLYFSGLLFAGKANRDTGNGLTVPDYRNISTAKLAFDSTGAIQQDVWIPFFPDGNAITNMNVIVGTSPNTRFNVGSNTPAVGKVYNLSGKF